MRVIDLTRAISPDMPVYPGTEGPKFEVANTYEKDGFKETLLTMYTHTGTHIDPPAHLFGDKTTLGQFDVTQFVGKALVIDCSGLSAGQCITMDDIHKNQIHADEAEFLLFYTGWEQYWGTETYFGEYPCIDREVAEYLMKSHKKGIGLDTIGLDPVSDTNLTLHKLVLESGEFVIIENLMNLKSLAGSMFTFCALPLKHVDADGSPIRAVAIL